MKFTMEAIRRLKLPAGKDDHTEYDETIPGWLFRIRRTTKGANRYWQFEYQVGDARETQSGRKRRARRKLTYGRYPVMDVPEAREKAERLHAETMLGNDPQAMKQENRRRAVDTYEACVQMYLAWLRSKKRLAAVTLSETERHLTRNLAGLDPLRIDQIDQLRLAAELKTFAARTGAEVQANRTATSCHGFFVWCRGEGLIVANPAAGLNRFAEAARDRVLSLPELAHVLRACTSSPSSDYFDIIWLLVLTGQRKNEIGSLRWSEIDLDNAVVTLPAPRVKNRRKHSFPLSGPALAILKRRFDARRSGRDLVFGRGNGGRGFSGWSLAKTRLDATLNLEPWVVHDLRRSFSTGLGDLGVPPHVIEMLINHQSGTKSGVSGRYNWSVYEKEGRQAVELWAESVVATVEERAPCVVPLQRGAR